MRDHTSSDREDFARDRFIIGDKVAVKEEIARYRELLGIDHFIMRCQWLRRKRQLVAAQAARVAILGFQFHGSSSLSRLIG